MGAAICVWKWLSLVIILVYSLLELCTGQIVSQCARKEKVQLTLMSFKPQNSESTVAPLPHYECYLGAEDGDAVVSSYRPYRTRNRFEPQPSSPVRLTENSLPANTAAYRVTLDTGNDYAFGVFSCNALRDDRQNTTVFTIFLRSDGYIVPSDEIFTKTVNVGDRDVIIDMTLLDGTGIPSASPGSERLDIRWRINGSGSVDVIGEGVGDYQGVDYTQLTSRGISVDDEGVYEPHGNGLRNAHHALQRLIVHSCVVGRWGPPGCTGVCENCYNGGVCDDETGRCICPPGFMGTNCVTECGANRFGYSCEFQCDYAGNTDCIGRQFCLLDPYGCTCNTGYKDLDCMADCEHTKYGAGCLQQCHCAGNQGRCDRFTGVCVSGTCQNGWSGSNCQIPDNCPTGYFGNDCTEKCLCMNNVACDKNSGACNNGVQCAPGALKPIGSVRCQECPDGFHGDSCSEACHCESDACDKATGECVGCCKPQWLNTDSNTCQTGLEGSGFMKVNSGQLTSVTCDTSSPSIITAYRTVLSRERDSVVESGIRRGSASTGMNNQGSLISSTDFTINNVSSTDVFYCLLVSNMEPRAWLNTTFSAYELPVLSDPPVSYRQTNDAVTIRWRPWDAEMDVGDPPVVSYVTYYKEVAGDMWTRASHVSHNATLEFTAPDLMMDVNYTFSVAAVREGDGGEGPRSPPLTVKTLCGDPAVPSNVEAVLTDDNKVQVSWQITPGSVTCSTGITHFTVYAQIEGSSNEPIEVGFVGGEMTSYIISEGLEDGVSYTFLVSSTTDREGAQSIRSETVLYTSGSSPIVLIVIIIFIVLAIVIILILVVVKRYYLRKGPQDKSESDRAESAVYTNDGMSNEPTGYSSLELDSKEATSPSYYHHLHQGQHGETMSEYEETDMSKAKTKVSGLAYEDVGNSQPGRYILPKPPTGPQTNSAVQFEYHDYEDPGDFENYTGVYINIPDTHHLFSPEPIKVSEFQSFMRKDKTQLMERIVKEFMILPKGRQYPCSVAQQHCLQRNNSQEILPYDHSRVVLTSLGNMNESDYYNASYIKDHKGKICFVAAQGPGSKYKISEFWRMIWQEKVKTIVMLTDSNQAVDAGRAAYWPKKVKTGETYGELTVLGMEVTSYHTYTVRKMKVLHNNDDKIHTVQQIHLHMWPFRGVPEDISDLIAVIKKVKTLHGRGAAGPLLVHCSNGSGATGTFIAIYSLMDVLKESKTISVFDFVSNMRKDRMDMVQTRIQYLFIYQTLQDAQLFPEDSNLSCSQLKNLSDRILNKKAEQEFKVLRKMDENSRQTKSKVGRLATNAHKNRFKGIIPLDKYRATLKSEGLSPGSSDYINASFAENDDSRYILMAQSPLPATVEDFWRLVYDYQCKTVIMLDNANSTDKTFVQYWPDGRAVYASITVDLVKSMKFDTFTKRTFTVTHQDFKESLFVEQLVYDGLEKKQDIDIKKLAKFISSTESDRSKTLVVHCINGVGLSAVYVVVRSQMESVKNGDECDVFLAVQKLRMRNPLAIQTQDEYILCLQLLRCILNSQEEYAVVY